MTALRKEAISYAAFRLIEHRFSKSPRFYATIALAEDLFANELGLDRAFRDTNYTTGSAAALGNYIAAQFIAYGLQDGSNEINEYRNQYYATVNEALNAESPGNPTISDPNRWQPLAFDVFRDQSGNIVEGGVPTFLSPEWGNVQPFAMTDVNLTWHFKDGNEYQVYYDPGPPPLLNRSKAENGIYEWNFSMVAVWSGHLGPSQEKVFDISPYRSIILLTKDL